MDLYPQIIYDTELEVNTFDDDVDGICDEILEACKGWGSDKKRLVDIMKKLTPTKRVMVAARYKQKNGQQLKDKMKDEVTGDLEHALRYLGSDPLTAETDMLRLACKGMGGDKTIVYSILSGRTNKDMALLKKKFFEVHEVDMGQVLDQEFGGAFEKFVFNVLQADEKEYDHDYFTEEKMLEDAKTLYEHGQGKFGTDAGPLFKILVGSPAEYLKKLNLVYADKYGITLPKLVEEEFRGETDDAAGYLLGMKLKPEETIAKMINKSLAGMGTDEELLMCTILRYQPYLNSVNPVFTELYGKSLQDSIGKEVRGNLKDLLLGVIETAESL